MIMNHNKVESKMDMGENVYHVPVMVPEMLSYLITDKNGIYVDGTLGGGGYSEALAQELDKQGIIIAIDRDLNAIEHAKKRLGMFKTMIQFFHDSFDQIDQILSKSGIEAIDGIVLDLGLSSAQIDQDHRGFSYLGNGPLDMRMNQRQTRTASLVINTYSESQLADIFYWYGEERHARRIARRLVQTRAKKTIETTNELAEFLRSCTPYKFQIKTLSRVFQAIRIEVNDELTQLKDGLEKSYHYLKSGGRVVVVTYHSLEARLVKRFFRGQLPDFRKGEIEEKTTFQFNLLNKKAVKPGDEEIKQNPRARSAMLRAAEKI